MDPSGAGFEAPALPSILPGPAEDDIDWVWFSPGLGSLLDSACTKFWRKISVLLLWLWKEEFWKHLEKCNNFSLTLLSWL